MIELKKEVRFTEAVEPIRESSSENSVADDDKKDNKSFEPEKSVSDDIGEVHDERKSVATQNEENISIPTTIEKLGRVDHILPKLPERVKPPRRKKKQKLIPTTIDDLVSEDARCSIASTKSEESNCDIVSVTTEDTITRESRSSATSIDEVLSKQSREEEKVLIKPIMNEEIKEISDTNLSLSQNIVNNRITSVIKDECKTRNIGKTINIELYTSIL